MDGLGGMLHQRVAGVGSFYCERCMVSGMGAVRSMSRLEVCIKLVLGKGAVS